LNSNWYQKPGDKLDADAPASWRKDNSFQRKVPRKSKTAFGVFPLKPFELDFRAYAQFRISCSRPADENENIREYEKKLQAR